MLESSKVGINFAGKDGFYWFIGQVTADYAWRDKNNQNVELGYRAKVRILGHHPPESAAERNCVTVLSVSIFSLKSFGLR